MITPEDLVYAGKLKKLRRTSRWKQLLAAEKTGMSSQQEYSKLESGKIHFSDAIIKRVCAAYNVNVEDFKSLREVNKDDYAKFKKAIEEKRVKDIEAEISRIGLITLLLAAEKKYLISEIDATNFKLKQLLLPKFEDVDETKEHKIYVMI
ncbi:MAG TPA: helix-turn-helix transcriptional regulator [Bacteroidia bacterium]|nr:helix-turn-helix transcriptional regulator [Bacteroidia bacterium]